MTAEVRLTLFVSQGNAQHACDIESLRDESDQQCQTPKPEMGHRQTLHASNVTGKLPDLTNVM